MQRSLIPPRDPQHDPVRPPRIYIEKRMKLEYKQIVRNLEAEKPLDENDLNALGEDGWEMTRIARHPPITYFCIKRQIE